jgi:hypothetical protein
LRHALAIRYRSGRPPWVYLPPWRSHDHKGRALHGKNKMHRIKCTLWLINWTFKMMRRGLTLRQAEVTEISLT